MRSRRTVLLTTIAIGPGGLAGCSRGGPDTPDDGPVVTEPSATPADATIEDVSLESGDGSCGSEPSAEITQSEGGVKVTGEIVASTPCYLATLEATVVDARTATVRIGVREDPEADVCVECVGIVPFELSAHLGSGIETVVVELEGNEPETFRKQLQ
jgi:hypothetical protein